MKLLLLLIFRNLRRSWLRTSLTALGTIVLVVVVTLVWSFLGFLDDVTAEKSKNFKAIVTERWQIPSQMPYTYAATLADGAARHPDDVRPTDSMTWQFYGGTLDPKNMTRENMVFAIAMDPQQRSHDDGRTRRTHRSAEAGTRCAGGGTSAITVKGSSSAAIG